MKMTAKLATVVVVAVVVLGVASAAASAGFLAGPAFTGTAVPRVFSVNGAAFTCTGATFDSTAAGSATAVVTPSSSGCPLKLGTSNLPAAVAVTASTTGADPVSTPGIATDGALGDPLSPVLPPL